MADEEIIERIDADLEELIPKFMENTRKDLDGLRRALEAGDFETVKRLGHSTKGAAFGYGFTGLGEIGLNIETAAPGRNRTQLSALLDQMGRYLDQVTVVFA
jgi:HPt (histidine-containing phosphotransfer) domain-containing protein